MKSLLRIILLLVFVLIAGSVVMLGISDSSPPTSRVEKEIPNDRFPR